MGFPSSIPSYNGFISDETLQVAGHAAQHNQEQADIIQLAGKIGIGGATPVVNQVLRGSGTGTSNWDQVHLATDISGFGSNVTNFLSSPSSSTLASVLPDETGTGDVVFNNTPSLTNPQTTSLDNTGGATNTGGFTTDTITVNSSISGAGYSAATLYNPYKFSVYRNAAWNWGNGVNSPITFDTVTFDTGSNYSTSTGEFVVSAPGFYYFTAAASVSSTTNGAVYIIYLFKNGSLVKAGNAMQANGTIQLALTVSGLLQLATNDYIQIYNYGNNNAGVTGASETYFDGFLVSET